MQVLYSEFEFFYEKTSFQYAPEDHLSFVLMTEHDVLLSWLRFNHSFNRKKNLLIFLKFDMIGITYI
jgi:TorA maturation chaperone TorD